MSHYEWKSNIGRVHARLPDRRKQGHFMIYYTVVFLVIALVAALFGFTGIAAGAVEIARILFFIFLVLFVISLVMGVFRRK